MTETAPAPTNLDHTREAWLRVAAARFIKEIEMVSGLKLEDVRVSMGFGGRRYERGVAGVCHARRADKEGVNQIFISPEIGDMAVDPKGRLVPATGDETVGVIPATAVVLMTLRHELLHAALDNEGGHGIKAQPSKGIEKDDRFPEYATRLGFDAPFAYLAPSPGLVDEMVMLAIELGEFPHAQLTVREDVTTEAPTGGRGGTTTITSAGGSDTNRWISFYCDEHASPIRMSSKKAARCALICLELTDSGMPCMKPLHRGK